MSAAHGPPPPNDPEFRIAIERMAAYVASQGPEGEELARKANYGNPRMAFLFGAEGSTYYQYRLAFEISNLMKIASAGPPQPTPLASIKIPPHAVNAPAPVPTDVDVQQLEAQITNIQTQIERSEANLKAHHASMQEQKKADVDKIFQQKDAERVFELMRRVGIVYDEFVKSVDQLSTSGSKEQISKCKHWILDHCDTDQKREIILTYLLHRCRGDSVSNIRLHILYLINDWAYYCQRQRLDDVRQMLSRYVPKMYAYASSTGTLTSKLDKLVGVWEGSKYFDENCYKLLLNPTNIMSAEQFTITAEKAKIAENIEKELNQTYANYQKQHIDYEKHMLAQIARIKHQIRQIQEAKAASQHFGPVGFNAHDRTPKCPYYELPAGMMAPLVKPDAVTLDAINTEKMLLPPRELMNDRIKFAFDRFYAFQRNPQSVNVDADGWEVDALSEFYAEKQSHKDALMEKMNAEGKVWEDLITNKITEPLECDKPMERGRSRSRSSSYSRSSRSSSSSSSRSRSRSASPEHRPSFGGPSSSTSSHKTPAFVKSSSQCGDGVFKMPALPLHRDESKGTQMLQKMRRAGE